MNESEPPQPKPKKLFSATTTYYIAVSTLLVGVLGGTIATSLYMQPRIDEAIAATASTIKERDGARHDLAEMERATEEKQSEMDARAKELEEKEAALDAREGKVTAAETKQAARELRDGFHTVGKTVEAGTYTTTVSSGMCYYAWKTGTGSDAGIVDNNIVESGPATITLIDGEFI